MISHQTHDEGKRDWHLSVGSMYWPDWFDCVCILSASIDGNDFDPHSALSLQQQNPLRWKMHTFHIPFSINLCNHLIKMGDYIFFLCWLKRMSTRRLHWKQKTMVACLPFALWKRLQGNHTPYSWGDILFYDWKNHLKVNLRTKY